MFNGSGGSVGSRVVWLFCGSVVKLMFELCIFFH